MSGFHCTSSTAPLRRDAHPCSEGGDKRRTGTEPLRGDQSFRGGCLYFGVSLVTGFRITLPYCLRQARSSRISNRPQGGEGGGCEREGERQREGGRKGEGKRKGEREGGRHQYQAGRSLCPPPCLFLFPKPSAGSTAHPPCSSPCSPLHGGLAQGLQRQSC